MTSIEILVENVEIDGDWRHKPTTEEAIKYEGWGTALKPANEPICVARKPLSEKTVAENVLKWGTGGINIDGCRVGTETIMTNMKNTKGGLYNLGNQDRTNEVENTFNEGRFPANIIFDESAAEMLDKQSGLSKSGVRKPTGKGKDEYDSTIAGGAFGDDLTERGFNDKGGASRYFFNVKNNGGIEDFFIYKENNIIIWNIKSLDTQEYNTEDCIEASDVLKQARESICQKPELYGNNTLVKYLTTTISITKMKTHSIMTFPILNASTKMNIGHFTLMIDEKQSQLLTEESILNVQIVNNQNVLVSSIKTNQEVLVPIVSYVLEENLKSGETIIENTITNTTENIGTNRFFYVAKVSKKERNLGLDGFEDKEKTTHKSNFRCELCNYQKNSGTPCKCENPLFKEIEPKPQKNSHPTLKPINLMTYLCRLVTPEGGVVLDPFMGSGSTGISALLEGFNFIGMELDEEYFKIAEERINSYEDYRKLLKK